MPPPSGAPWRAVLTALAVLTLLAGCSSTPPPQADAPPRANRVERPFGAGQPAVEPFPEVSLGPLRPAPLPQEQAALRAVPLPAPQNGGSPAQPDVASARDGRIFRHAPGPEAFADLAALEPYLHGVASWYGPGFHGKRTANGEVYNQYGLTAAHPVLPLGTRIEVTNVENGRTIWLRVNDRGPYKKGRILDLSRTAAEHLGIVDEGTARVSIRVLRFPDDADTRLGIRAYMQYVVQVGAYPTQAEAARKMVRIASRHDWARFHLDPKDNGFTAIITGPFDDEASAQAVARRLQQAGVTNFVRLYRK